MNRVSSQIYDVIGILIPGAIVLCGVYMGVPETGFVLPAFDFLGVIVFLIASFILGHLLNSLSRTFYITLIKIVLNDYSTAAIKNSAFALLPLEVQNKIIQALKEHYGLEELPRRGSVLEMYCIAPVHDRMERRHRMMSVARFQRCLSFLSFVAAVGAVALFFLSGIHVNNLHWIGTAAGSLLLAYIFFRGYIFFSVHAATVGFISFLSWFNENRNRDSD